MAIYTFDNICSDGSNRFIAQLPDAERLNLAQEIAEDLSAQTGLKITTNAILWQLENWMYDYKSGFRDDDSGYFLFSPCGCNAFSITVYTLDEDFAKGQKTYYA